STAEGSGFVMGPGFSGICGRKEGVEWRSREVSALQPISGPEDPGDDGEEDRDEGQCDGEADADIVAFEAEEGPAEAGDEVDDGVELRDAAPGFGEHVDGVE